MKKLFLTLIFFGCIFGQELPQPALIGVDLKKPTLKISKIVEDKNTGIVDKRITLGLPNLLEEAFQIRLNVIVTEISTQKKIISRGVGTIQTDIASAGLQIEEDIPFNRSELGGAVRKAIDDATKELK